METKIETYSDDGLKALLYGAKRNRYLIFNHGDKQFRGGRPVRWRDETWYVYDADAEGRGLLLCLKQNAKLARYVNPDEVTPL